MRRACMTVAVALIAVAACVALTGSAPQSSAQTAPSATAAATATPAPTPSGPPADFVYGSLTINGQNAPAGTVVYAYSDVEFCGAAAYDGRRYVIGLDSTIWQCWAPHYTIRFLVGGQTAHEALFTPPDEGSVLRLDLTVGYPQ